MDTQNDPEMQTRSTVYRYLLGFGLLLGVMIVAMVGLNDKANAGSDASPRDYRLADVVISVVQQPGNPAFNLQTVSIHGNGSCRQLNTKPAASIDCPRLSRSEVVDLINEFYRIRYFDMKDNYRMTQRVVLLDGDRLVQSVLRLLDKESTRLTFKVQDYEKSINFVEDIPEDINKLIRKILALTK